MSKIFSFGGKAMNTNQGMKADERMAAVMRASNTWSLSVILYGLLIDIMYRSAVLREAPWDLFALVVLSGAVSAAYAARHEGLGQVFGRRTVIFMVLSALVAAVISAIFALDKAM
jgi:hypothetical protein